jgi:hypothetical protein
VPEQLGLWMRIGLVAFIVLLPVWLVPVLSVLWCPELPLVRSFLYGAVFSLVIALGLRAVQVARTFGARFLVVLIIVASLAGLLIVFLSRLL